MVMNSIGSHRLWRRSFSAGLTLQDVFIGGHVLVYLICIIMMLFYPNINVTTKVFYTVGLVYAGIMTTLLLEYMRFCEGYDRRLCNLLLAYFTVAFVVKLPFMLYFPSLSWSSSSRLMGMSPEWVIHNLPATFAIFLIGYSGFVLGIFLFLATKQSMSGGSITRNCSGPLEPYRLNRLAVIVPFLLIFKWILGYYFHIGIPGAVTGELFIPYLNGIASLLVQYGLLFVVNLGLLVALAAKNRRYALMFGVFVFVYVGMDIGFGNKQDIVFEPFILFWICATNWQWLPKRMVRYALITTVVVACVGIPSYKYLNAYRGHLTRGADITLALQKAQASEAGGDNSLVQIYQRIVGLDVLEAASQTSLSEISRGKNPLTANVADEFKLHIMGVHLDLKSGYGFTQIGRAYALSGYAGTLIYMAILGIAYFWLYSWVLRYLVKREVSRSVLSVIMGIIFVHFTMQGASPVLTFKLFGVLLVTAYIAEKILQSSGRFPQVWMQGRQSRHLRRIQG